ncbi:hypothetical protein [Streptomyces sp. NBC_01483]|uniref:hypothetical protein n=1 Tax=Streptomyces sp. NBC_01483 TaxID=2903883 RepID=UPI002E2FD647|nr:hypothetical protein [Streptomyces sp. NBC_01483]
MPHHLAAAIGDQEQPVRVRQTGRETLCSVLVRPVDVDAWIPGTGVLGEQRAAARDKPFDVGRFGLRTITSCR